MILMAYCIQNNTDSWPRTSGDDPVRPTATPLLLPLAPHERG